MFAMNDLWLKSIHIICKLLTAYSVSQSAGLEDALLCMHFNHFAIFGHKTSQFRGVAKSGVVIERYLRNDAIFDGIPLKLSENAVKHSQTLVKDDDDNNDQTIHVELF